MRSIIIYSRLLILSFTLFHMQASFSAEYTWIYEHSGGTITASSPSSVCQQVAQLANSQAELTNGRYRYQFKRLAKQYQNSFICIMSRTLYPEGTNGGDSTYGSASRRGDSCPVDYIYNPDNGECEPPPPDCSAASPGIFKSPPGPVINSNGANYVIVRSPGTVCYNQCSYLTNELASSCFFIAGSQTEGFCNYIGNATGDNCAEPDYPLGAPGDPLNPPNTPDTPPSDPKDPGCPPGYGWSGTTCAKNPDDGGADGGDGGGGDTGGGDTGGGDTGGGGPGNGGGDTGGGGPGNGGGGPGNGGGDTGDGEGQCDPATDPNKCGKSSVGGEACNVQLKCEGDAIQCAILRMNKEQVCQWTYDANVKKQIADEMSGEAYQLEESSIPVSGLFTEALNKGRWLPQTCPAPQTMNVMGNTYSFSWEPLCRFATAMGPIIVALASIFFSVYIGRALKGS